VSIGELAQEPLQQLVGERTLAGTTGARESNDRRTVRIDPGAEQATQVVGPRRCHHRPRAG
jgi:hypothetical protein